MRRRGLSSSSLSGSGMRFSLFHRRSVALPTRAAADKDASSIGVGGFLLLTALIGLEIVDV